jgi:hypothetical protein
MKWSELHLQYLLCQLNGQHYSYVDSQHYTNFDQLLYHEDCSYVDNLLVGQHKIMLSMYWIAIITASYINNNVELLHLSHFYHVSLVQWTNCLLPATGGSGLCLRGVTHTLELGILVRAVLLTVVTLT